MADPADIATLRRSLQLAPATAGGPADADVGAVLDQAAELLTPYVDQDDAGAVLSPALFGEAVQIVAADMWQARAGMAGATITGADFAPAPAYRMGRSLLSRVRGILATSWNVNGMVG